MPGSRPLDDRYQHFRRKPLMWVNGPHRVAAGGAAGVWKSRGRQRRIERLAAADVLR
jgi:hypothetical protein